jgi:hypothetical protein
MTKRVQRTLAAIIFSLAFAAISSAQMGMNFFKKPSIANIFKPVVGAGSVYETDDGQKKETLEMSVVSKDTADGKEAFWLEFGHPDVRSGQLNYVKLLVTRDDFQPHRIIVQSASHPQPMEFPVNPGMSRQFSMQEDAAEKWQKVGTEIITVPAGTFSCDHWTKGEGKGDVWVSGKVSPMSLVKQTSPGRTMVLVKVLSDAQDHITGTPMKMDPQQMMQQHQRPQP